MECQIKVLLVANSEYKNKEDLPDALNDLNDMRDMLDRSSAGTGNKKNKLIIAKNCDKNKFSYKWTKFTMAV